MESVSEQCRSCIVTLGKVVTTLSYSDHTYSLFTHTIKEQLERLSLFAGNIGALHAPESPMSVESRLKQASDVLLHIKSLLSSLNDVVYELLQITSGEREGMHSSIEEADEDINEEISEVGELQDEMEETISRLFRVSFLIRQAAPTDIFAKALSRNRYLFDDQFDIAHVGEKCPKLSADEHTWLRRRLGRAITQRRQYLSYIRDHREALESVLMNTSDMEDGPAAETQAQAITPLLATNPMLDTTSRPSYVSKATTVDPERLTAQRLAAQESDPEDDARSYTTVSRSVDDGHESSTTVRIPKLDDLRIGNKKEIECPFCFRIKKFKNERVWRKHVFSDLRSYICTFPDCTTSYFEDINAWFQHEMSYHRVSFKCLLCPNAIFHEEKKYQSHLRKRHPEIQEVEDNEIQPAMDLARRPLAQIPASDCPCCSDWADRLSAQAGRTNDISSGDIIAVLPTTFKRHLAGHLEQLALFSIPIASGPDGDDNSNAAIEETLSQRTKASEMSALSFTSSPGDVAGAFQGMKEAPFESELVRTDVQPGVLEGEPTTAPLTFSVETSESSKFATPSREAEIPLPAFLRKSSDDIDKQWISLEMTQLNRLRNSVHDETDITGSDYTLCNTEQYASGNRYANVSPYLANRVKLEVPEGYDDYINASPIVLRTTKSGTTLRYIATQGPKITTWSHLWRMVWNETQDPAVIVMLTQLYEAGREKSFLYYPTVSNPTLCVNEHDEYGDGSRWQLSLDPLELEHAMRTDIGKISMTTGEESRTVWHLRFDGWPDFSTPEGEAEDALIRLIELSRAKNSDNSNNPRIVHCSAGVGRTGTFIALDWLLQELDEGSFDDLSDDQDPIGAVVEKLREQRHGMVQGKNQFLFLYKAVRKCWRERWLDLNPAEVIKLEVATEVAPAQSYSEYAEFIQKSKSMKSGRKGADYALQLI